MDYLDIFTILLTNILSIKDEKDMSGAKNKI